MVKFVSENCSRFEPAFGSNLICGEASVLARVSHLNLTLLAVILEGSPSNLPQKSFANFPVLRGGFTGLKFTALAKAAALGFRSIILRIAHR